ncbi:hypothetical protein [Luteibacter yeojuensis]|uniref:Uncharacterized protein n=1 Tax=Luteibacter yeojuensis TaxID=345309 RepID=A0A7X5QY17_9GAMM|nr:hypothetical protein [Luteibacter yeojuensis]NID17466.1 hypothetical protein [Luteibacter yeojuensis]
MSTEGEDFGEEGARPSSLIPVHKLSTRDPLHDMQLLRDVAIINEQVRRELGPPPRVVPQQKPEKESEDMKPRDLAMAALLGTSLVGVPACSPTTPVSKSGVDTMANSDRQSFNWPLRFTEHKFTAVCYSTLACNVWYAGVRSGDREPSSPSSEYGPNYLDHILGGHTGIANFPEPAELAWRSMDGVEHEARIDIGEIFRDRVIRHRVPREEVSEQPNRTPGENPQIMLEINDRTVRVYMRAFISTRHLQKPGNPYSGFRNDLILAKSYHY